MTTTAATVLTPATAARYCIQKRVPKPPSEFIRAINLKPSSSGWGAAAHGRSSAQLIVSRASSSSSAPKTSSKGKRKIKKDDGDDPPDDEDEAEEEEKLQQQQPSSVSVIKRLDDVNPVGLGRRSRQIFDEVWRKFSGLGQISRTTRTDDEASLLISEGGPMCEFATPGAQNTTVLVVGATSRVGRIVVRKLMLRGYTVKVSLPLSLLPTLPPFRSQ